MSEDCCATGCDVREGSCFQSSEKRQWRVAENFLRNMYFLRITKIDQLLSNEVQRLISLLGARSFGRR